MRPKRRQPQRIVHAVSLGCGKNLVDTEVMLGALVTAGYAVSADPGIADVLLVNTCGFIDSAAAEARGVITELAAVRDSHPGSILVVAGCLAQRDGEKLRRDFPQIDILVGTSSYHLVAELIEKKSPAHFGDLTFIHGDGNPRLLATPPWTAYLKIAEGCSNHCAYCIIPSLRGEYRSRDTASLLREARMLADSGVRELVVIAQDITRYGSDRSSSSSNPVNPVNPCKTRSSKSSLSNLIRKLAEIDSLHWIRLMYAYPESVDKTLARVIAQTPKVCKYLEMPIQHIDAGVLEAMGRRGGPEAIEHAVAMLRAACPDICLRTTVMLGFPGETEKAFERLMMFLERVKFDRLGAFTFSPQAGTPAAAMPGKVRKPTAQRRLDAVMRLQQEISLGKNMSFIGKTLEVLVEGEQETEDGRILAAGRSFRDAPDIDGFVLFPPRRRLRPGSFVDVTITSADEYDLFGE